MTPEPLFQSEQKIKEEILLEATNVYTTVSKALQAEGGCDVNSVRLQGTLNGLVAVMADLLVDCHKTNSTRNAVMKRLMKTVASEMNMEMKSINDP